MYNILTLNKISKYGLEKLDAVKYSCADSCENPDAVLVRSAAMHDFAFSPVTAAVARAGAGVNNIPVEACAEKGIVVFNTPGANANAVKELVICSLFMASRKIGESLDWCKTLKGEGDAVGNLVEKGKSAFAGPEIMGKTLGVGGLGARGALVAGAAYALGMDIIGYDPYLSPASAQALTFAKITDSLDELYACSDYITLHVPLTDGTRSSICEKTLAGMKDGVRILNFSRGELVNSDDILSALESGKCAAYITDFPTDAQLGAKGVTAIPHLGASTPESEDNCAVMAAVEVSDYLEKGIIKNSVNYPAASLPESFAARVCLLHKADAAFAEKAVSAVSAQGVSLKNTFSAEKKDFGYTVIDTDKAVDISVLEALPGVLRVRALG